MTTERLRGSEGEPFDIHGIRLRLDTACSVVRDLVATTYEAFASHSGADGEIVVRLVAAEGELRLSDSRGAGETVMRSETDAAAQTLERFTEIVLAGLAATDRLAIHAAAVVRDGSVVVVSGPSGSGKTTVALGLVERGMALLSDEMAVIEPDGMVLPHPRSLHVRPGTPELLAAADLVGDAVQFDTGAGEKWSVSPSQLARAMPGSRGEASPLGHVLLLGDRPSPSRAATLSPIPAALAAVELCRAAPAAQDQLPTVVRRLGTLLDGVRCARLELGALPDALELISGWLDDGDAAVSQAARRSEPDQLHLSTARLGLFEYYRREGERAWVRGGGNSMRPVLRPDDLILVEFGSQPRHRGEVVVFAERGRILAHRVLAIRDGGARLITKGDGSARFDPPRPTVEILGVVRARRRSGHAAESSTWLSGPLSRLVAGISLLIGLLARRTRTT